MPSLKDRSYKFNSWIPQGAIDCIRDLRRNSSLDKDALDFIQPVFEEEGIKSFFGAFTSENRFFFSDFFYPLLRARSDLHRRQARHIEMENLASTVTSLQNQITKMQETLSIILKSEYFQMYLFEKFPTVLAEMESYIPNVKFQMNKIKNSVGKNPHRPINRKNLNVLSKSDEQKRQIEAAYYARFLMLFFENVRTHSVTILKVGKKKEYVCNIVNVLSSLRDNPLTPKKIDDLLSSK